VSSPKPKPNNAKKQSTHDRVDYSSNKDQYRFNHSKLLTLVFEEADVQFQERRQRLNNLAIKKCEPKKKASKRNQKASEAASVDFCCTPDIGVKAGKTVHSLAKDLSPNLIACFVCVTKYSQLIIAFACAVLSDDTITYSKYLLPIC
jgi:hypothetical protein